MRVSSVASCVLMVDWPILSVACADDTPPASTIARNTRIRRRSRAASDEPGEALSGEPGAEGMEAMRCNTSTRIDVRIFEIAFYLHRGRIKIGNARYERSRCAQKSGFSPVAPYRRTAMNTSSFISPHLTDHPQPLSGNAMPRCGGIATMMRLPNAGSPQGL